ncbi:MAG: hypothetical protein FD169_536 [Bacillota bacterium]|nr:MAG: hypothetical protein FD169_536 [Bacillota bacterium]MBS3950519.1 hypothetical protein [Peptococcaceae bacterium]
MDKETTYKKIKTVLNTVVLIGIGIYLIFAFTNMNYDYTLNDQGVTISRGKGIDIAFTEIVDVQYFERLPALSNRVGESLGNRRNGTFTVAGIGRGKVYVTDITKPGIIIFTADTFYAITPPDSQNFFIQLEAIIK